MWFITQILGFLSGGFVDRLLSHFEKKQALANDKDKIKADVVVEAIKAEMDSRKLARDIIISEQGSLLASLVRPLFVYPLIVYWTLIIGDSIFQWNFDILALPEPMATWSTWMVGSYFVSRPIEKMVRGYVNKR